jgi:hypothetical protein
MFLRVVRAAGGKGVTHEYVRVVEAFRQDGKTRHRNPLVDDKLQGRAELNLTLVAAADSFL